MTECDYPFDEFEKHFEDLYEGERLSGDLMQGLMNVRNYFFEKYGDTDEAREKGTRFSWIIHYLQMNVTEFDKADYGVYGSDKVGGLISSHIFKAVHEFFTESYEGINPSVRTIMIIADRNRAREDDGSPEYVPYRIKNDPRTHKLRELINERFPGEEMNVVSAVGAIVMLLRWTYQNAPDGNLAKFSPQVIANVVEWGEDPEAFTQMLIESDFLDDERKFQHLEVMFKDYVDFYGWAFEDK